MSEAPVYSPTERPTAGQPGLAWWGVALAVGGALFAAGGSQHPDSDPGQSIEAALAQMTGAPTWVLAHALILAGAVLLVPGLLGLARSGLPFTSAARTAAWFAVAGSVLYVAESAFHLMAFVDRAALAAGQPTPVLTVHLALAVFANPAFGFSLAALALLSGRVLVHPVIGVIGAIGGLAYGLAAPLLLSTRIQGFDVLFTGAIPLAFWLLVVGSAVAARSIRH